MPNRRKRGADDHNPENQPHHKADGRYLTVVYPSITKSQEHLNLPEQNGVLLHRGYHSEDGRITRQKASRPRARGQHKQYGFGREAEPATKHREPKDLIPIISLPSNELYRVGKKVAFEEVHRDNDSQRAISGVEAYVYKRLKKAEDFRLVKILPEATRKLKCEIMHASLHSPPDYVAISYAWGDGFEKKELFLEGARKLVAASLYDALKAVRRRGKEVLVWIDGLSIDQQSNVERASQVRLMTRIYSLASSVAIWLGPDADGSERATRLLQDLSNGKVSDKWLKDEESPDASALHRLFKRNYWRRLWVVQEVHLARKKRVYCGHSRLPWDAYKKASDVLWEHENDPYFHEGPSSFPDIKSLLRRGPSPLLEVLRACRKKLSENPRDKIFGVLGILPGITPSDLTVDYNQSVKSLYINVANLIISSARRLDVIPEAIHFPSHPNSKDLPTWCPDWSHIPEISSLREKGFLAAGETNAEYEFQEDPRKIKISAVDLDVIEQAGVAVGTLCALQDYLMAFLHWRMLLLSAFDIPETEEVGNPHVEAFCETLSLGQVPWKWRSWMKPAYQTFSSLIQERMPRLVVSREFQQHADAGILETGELRPFVQKHFGDRMMGRTFCLTKTKLMGLGTGFMRSGDVIVVPFGCSTPILLRPEGRGNEFSYVGDVYIHGYMHGEAMKGKKPVKQYVLC